MMKKEKQVQSNVFQFRTDYYHYQRWTLLSQLLLMSSSLLWMLNMIKTNSVKTKLLAGFHLALFFLVAHSVFKIRKRLTRQLECLIHQFDQEGVSILRTLKGKQEVVRFWAWKDLDYLTLYDGGNARHSSKNKTYQLRLSFKVVEQPVCSIPVDQIVDNYLALSFQKEAERVEFLSLLFHYHEHLREKIVIIDSELFPNDKLFSDQQAVDQLIEIAQTRSKTIDQTHIPLPSRMSHSSKTSLTIQFMMTGLTVGFALLVFLMN